MSLTQPNLPVFYLDAGLALLATGVYTVTRPVASTYVAGVETPDPSPTVFQVQAVVNPLHGVDLQRLPEGRRSSDYREIFVAAALNTASDTYAADRVMIGNDTFEVIESDYWATMGDVWRCIVQRAKRLNVSAGGG